MSRTVQIGSLADAVMQELGDYANEVSEDVEKAVKKAANTVKKGISASAPVSSGKYAKSWTVKETSKGEGKLEMTVHSRNRYQLAHLLEFGHAKRNGGRVAAQPHIAQAEQAGIKQLEEDIRRSVTHG